MTALAPSGSARTRPTDQTGSTRASWPARLLGCTDLFAALALVAVAASARALPTGSTLRLVLTLPVLLFVPGYLLLQALLVPVRPGPGSWLHALLAIGLSLPLIGLLALSTSLVEGGFRPVPIVTMISLGCLVLATIGLVRRLRVAARTDQTSATSTPA